MGAAKSWAVTRVLSHWQSRPWTLQRHLLLYSVILLLPALVFCSLLFVRSALIERRQIERDIIDVAKSAAADIDNNLTAVITTLRALASSPALAHGDVVSFDQQLRAAAEPGSLDLVLSDGTGQELINTRVERAAALPRVAVAVWQKAAETARPYVSGLFQEPATGRALLSISISIIQDGKPAYLLVGLFPTERVLDVLLRQRVTGDWVLGASDANGVIIARTVQHEKFVGQRLRADLIRHPAANEEPLVWQTTNVLGNSVLRTTTRSKIADWQIAATVPLNVANAPLYESWLIVGALAVGFAVASALLARIFARRVAKPIVALHEGAKALGAGTAFAPVESRVLEVSEVAAALSSASLDLKARTAALAESGARLSGIVESAMDAIISVDERNTIVLFNTAAERLFLCSSSEAIGQPLDRFIPDRHRVAHRGHMREFAKGGATKRRMGGLKAISGLRADGTEFPMEAAISFVTVNGQKLFTVILRDISERQKAEEDQRKSEARLKAVLDNLFAFVGVLTLEGTLIEINRAPLDAAELQRDDVIGLPFWECPWWTWSVEVQTRLKNAIAAARLGETVRYDVQVAIGFGRLITIDFQIAPLRTESGEITHLVPSGIDVTERKQREEHIHLLMREITHRSKNLLSVIQAMARQTRAGSRSAAEFEARFSARLQALAASHDLLVQRNWHGVVVGDMVRSQLGHLLDQRASQIDIEGPHVVVAPEAAQNVGMALHELSTNATKYGALSVPGGRVEVRWTLDLDPSGIGNLKISWSERGGPAVEPPARKGFGHVVIERVAAQALNGKADLEFAKEGVRWSLFIPATHIIRDLHWPVRSMSERKSLSQN